MGFRKIRGAIIIAALATLLILQAFFLEWLYLQTIPDAIPESFQNAALIQELNEPTPTADYAPGVFGDSGHDSDGSPAGDSGSADTPLGINLPTAAIVEVRVAASSDDAEEAASGNISLTSSDLELILAGSDQTVGMRFSGVNVPPGATILNAYIQFQADEKNSEVTTLTIQSEAADDAPTFIDTKGNISSRARTVAAVSWSPAPWLTTGEAGPDQQTPDIAAPVQEVINRSGWSSGNSLVVIITGTGKRVAEAYDGVAAAAPLLHIEYTTGNVDPTPTAPSTPTVSSTPANTSDAASNIRFAVIGDYGTGSSNESAVASLVDSWNVDFVITLGDNNYPDGEAATIDEHIGQFYGSFIGNYQGAYGSGSATNRFWPSLGNHDWHAPNAMPYLDYFTLPGNERYYDVDLGLVHLFVIDSDNDEPDGRRANSIQGDWLQNALAASTSCFDVVYFHHPPYSSGAHGSRSVMQWPFQEWGADVVMSGHDHTYERIDVSGFLYFVNGLGGAGLYDFDNLGNLPPEAASVVRYNQEHGAMLVSVSDNEINYQFITASGEQIDDYTVQKSC